MFRQVRARPSPGMLIAVLITVALLAAGFLVVAGARDGNGLGATAGRVLTLFGTDKGTAKTPGLWFTNPFMTKKSVSLRIRNFETNKLKVIDTAEAIFEVNDYVQSVAVQSAAAVRTLASSYPYDHYGDDAIALDALSSRKIVTLDDERKAAMVSNLLVVLCSDRSAHPVVNTGTLSS